MFDENAEKTTVVMDLIEDVLSDAIDVCVTDEISAVLTYEALLAQAAMIRAVIDRVEDEELGSQAMVYAADEAMTKCVRAWRAERN